AGAYIGPAAEICDGVDNDCDGDVDEFLLNACGTCGPVPTEVCGDGVDNNCDGHVDEFCGGGPICGNGICEAGENNLTCPADCPGPVDADGDGFDNTIDCNDANFNIHPGAVELCNGLDDDCDSVTDEGCCGNGICEVGETPASCPADCGGGPIDADGDGFSPPADCNDSNFSVHPGAVEVCGNGIDNDCDGLTDEGCCGNGICEVGETPASCPADCGGGPIDADGDGFSPPADCNDSNFFVHPGAVEVCGNGIDNDCDGLTDEGCCGNGICEVGETPASCPADCGAAPVCGNGICEVGETPASCPADCAVSPTCGDGVCQSGETITYCPDDCLTLSCTPGDERQCIHPAKLGMCAMGKRTCQASGTWGSCISSFAPMLQDRCGNGADDDCDGQIDESGCQVVCGDGICWGSEPTSCPWDCLLNQPCVDGNMRYCWSAPGLGMCAVGRSTCVGGLWSSCAPLRTAEPIDYCNNALDDDCDGSLDEPACMDL
ncbi:MAG: putative metal-binding motif-containing protein, partial [Patescibacteria group bacterium]